MSCDNPDCRKMGCGVIYTMPEMLVEEIKGIQMSDSTPQGPVEEDGSEPKRQDVPEGESVTV